MGNSKETICGELLYEFMVHEKGFKISGRWNNHEQKKLLNDFAVMRQLIQLIELEIDVSFGEIKQVATVYKGNIIKNLIMDCQSYTKYRPNETTGGIFVSWRRKEELPTGA